MSDFKPLLAVSAELDKIKWPVYVSPKLDGIRCVILNGKALSRKLKPIPNHYVREALEAHADVLEGLDGELIVGDAKAPDVFNKSTSGIMSHDGEPDFRFYVFDRFSEGGYEDRWLRKYHQDSESGVVYPKFVKLVPQKFIHNLEELYSIEEYAVGLGYEGVMLRSPDGRYKCGRSTVKEGILLKVKRFEDIEAEVVGFEEKMHNENELQKDELGHAKRSSCKDGLVPAGTLGALICKHPDYEDLFKVGSGFDDATKQTIWDNQAAYLGKLAKIKHQPAGAKDKPRFPVFLGWRHEDDL